MIIEKARLIEPYGGELVDLLVPREELVEKTNFRQFFAICASQFARRVRSRTLGDWRLFAPAWFHEPSGLSKCAGHYALVRWHALPDADHFADRAPRRH